MKNPFIIIIAAIILIFILGTKAFWSILVLTIAIYLLIFVSNKAGIRILSSILCPSDGEIQHLQMALEG